MKKIVAALLVTLGILSVLYFVVRLFSSNFAASLFGTYTENIYEILPDNTAEHNVDNAPQIQHIAQELSNLELLKETTETPQVFKPRYYDGGKILGGDLEGMYKIIAIKDFPGVAEPFIGIFAAQTSNTYLIDQETRAAYQKLVQPQFKLNNQKIAGNAPATLGHPQTVNLDDLWSLSREKLNTEYIPTGQKDEDGNDLFNTIVATDLSNYHKVTTVQDEYDIYATYATTQFLVLDVYGIAYKYCLVFDPTERLILNATQLHKAHKDIRLYNSYSIALPSACVKAAHTTIAHNLSDDQLQEVGKIGETKVYTIKDPNHELNKQSFYLKISTQYYGNDTAFEQVNGRARPNFENYVKQTPLLIIKDPWERNVLLGESDFKLMEECE